MLSPVSHPLQNALCSCITSQFIHQVHHPWRHVSGPVENESVLHPYICHPSSSPPPLPVRCLTVMSVHWAASECLYWAVSASYTAPYSILHTLSHHACALARQWARTVQYSTLGSSPLSESECVWMRLLCIGLQPWWHSRIIGVWWYEGVSKSMSEMLTQASSVLIMHCHSKWKSISPHTHTHQLRLTAGCHSALRAWHRLSERWKA